METCGGTNKGAREQKRQRKKRKKTQRTSCARPFALLLFVVALSFSSNFNSNFNFSPPQQPLFFDRFLQCAVFPAKEGELNLASSFDYKSFKCPVTAASWALVPTTAKHVLEPAAICVLPASQMAHVANPAARETCSSFSSSSRESHRKQILGVLFRWGKKRRVKPCHNMSSGSKSPPMLQALADACAEAQKRGRQLHAQPENKVCPRSS